VSCSELAEVSGIAMPTLHKRINCYGWSVDQAVSTPVRGTRLN
jgi:uncharacterized protein YjcR